MEPEIEQNACKPTPFKPCVKQRPPLETQEWLIEQLGILAVASGEPMTQARLRIYADDLSFDLSREQLENALIRARRELRFFPKIAELREMAGGSRAEHEDAEFRKAWDVLMGFVRKYVGNDVHGNYGPQHGWYPRTYPELCDRILDTVRRTGGWVIYACMIEKDFPFIQKRFFEEYKAWTAVERVELPKLIGPMPRLQLVAKQMDHEGAQPESLRIDVPIAKSKAIPAPMTETQRRDRREMLRQQAEVLKKRDAVTS